VGFAGACGCSLIARTKEGGPRVALSLYPAELDGVRVTYRRHSGTSAGYIRARRRNNREGWYCAFAGTLPLEIAVPNGDAPTAGVQKALAFFMSASAQCAAERSNSFRAALAFLNIRVKRQSMT
jgi:hypothetical protein